MTIDASGKVWTTSTRQAAEELDAKFPRSADTGTYPGHGEIYPANGQGNVGQYAIDLMINTKAQGDAIAAYAWENRKRLGIRYVIWNKRIISRTNTPSQWRTYTNPVASRRGTASGDHTNHVHISRFSNEGYTAPAGAPVVTPPVVVTPAPVPPVVAPPALAKVISTPVRIVDFNAQWPEYASTRDKVAAGDVKPWSARKVILADKIVASGAKLLTIQELGQAEAADLFNTPQLRAGWTYQRLGLNVVAWRSDAFDYVKTRELTLDAHGQYPGRWYLEVWLKDKAGAPLRVGSSHLTVKTASDNAFQQAQIEAIVAFAGKSSDPLVIGIDTNNRQSGAPATGMWAVLAKAHYSWDRGGLDAFLWNSGVVITSTDSLPLGAGSDHDGRVTSLTTKAA